MTLSSLHIKTKYSKTQCDIVSEFYSPCMKESIRYDRLSGYFSSGVYIVIWDALQEFIENSGKIRLVCSPKLTDEDKIALKEGLKSKTDIILANSLLNEYNQMLESDQPIPAKLLACLVSQDILQIKLAVLPSDGIYHDKVGTFTDVEGNIVGFRGAMNETYKGLASDGNIESIEAFSTCEGDRDAERAKEAQDSFNEIWNEKIIDVLVYDLPSSVKYKFLEVSNKERIPDLLYKLKEGKEINQKNNLEIRKLRKHQENALADWYYKGRHGILEHATGSGKTFTAICAIRDSLGRGEIPLVLVPFSDLMDQWFKELTTSLADLDPTILKCDGKNSQWRQYITNFSSNVGSKSILLATIQTASNSDFQDKLSDGEHIFLVADEVHRCGSPHFRNVLNIESGPRLGLSATPKRYGDPEGTKAIYDYFGETLSPKYTLNNAIKDHFLTEYEYHPHCIELTSDEQQDWTQLTKKIHQRCIQLNKKLGDIEDISKYPSLRNLLIERARILKNAHNKIDSACEILQEYKYGERWLVYCESVSQITDLHNAMKKYDKLTNQTVLIYHSHLPPDTRKRNMDAFVENPCIMLSIKCLDEGIDIPSVSHALILASSKNPREFVQRRGRILRQYPGKDCAYLHDLIVVPYDTNNRETESSMLKSELARAILFGKGAKNPNCIARLMDIATEYDINVEQVSEDGYDDEQDDI